MYFRPSMKETYMLMALAAALRSVCIHYKVGVVLAKGKMPLCIGYNGPVRGEPHCESASVGCAKMENGAKLPSGSGKCRGAHAEINAISNAANLGVKIEGSSLYSTIRPCWECSKHIINAGIEEVVYLDDYDGEEYALEFLKRKVALVKFDVISSRAQLYREIFKTLTESGKVDLKGDKSEEDVEKIIHSLKS